jgi:O-antigen ligase
MHAHPRRFPLLPAGLLAIAAVLGVVVAIQPTIAIAIVGAAVLAYVIFSDLASGLAVLVLVSFVGAVPAAGSLSLAKAVGLFVAVGWLARYTVGGRGERDFFADHSYLAWMMIVFLGWGALTLVWAPETSAGLTTIYQDLLDLLLLPIVYTAVRSRRDLLVVLGAFVLGAAMAACVGILQPPDPSVLESTRATGTIGDPNEFSAALLGGLAIAAGFAAARGSSTLVRVGGLCVMPLCALGMFLSVSRGGLIALVVVFIAGTFAAGRWRGALLVVLLLTAGGGIFYFTQLAPLPARERVLTNHGGDGRSELWKVGMRIVRANPVGGIGAGNFTAGSRQYDLQPGELHNASMIFTNEPFPAHNTYLQLAAEEGIPGLLMLLVIIGACMRSALRAAASAARRRDITIEAFSRGVFLALVGMLTAEFFITKMHSKLVWLLLALGPALLATEREERAREPLT